MPIFSNNKNPKSDVGLFHGYGLNDRGHILPISDEVTMGVLPSFSYFYFWGRIEGTHHWR